MRKTHLFPKSASQSPDTEATNQVLLIACTHAALFVQGNCTYLCLLSLNGCKTSYHKTEAGERGKGHLQQVTGGRHAAELPAPAHPCPTSSPSTPWLLHFSRLPGLRNQSA
uniref:Uncharacterized protein n=1 Tax=Gopherus agassizii TaxID=38772 RepID=A0A452I6H9_9SAUR